MESRLSHQGHNEAYNLVHLPPVIFFFESENLWDSAKKLKKKKKYKGAYCRNQKFLPIQQFSKIVSFFPEICMYTQAYKWLS